MLQLLLMADKIADLLLTKRLYVDVTSEQAIVSQQLLLKSCALSVASTDCIGVHCEDHARQAYS